MNGRQNQQKNKQNAKNMKTLIKFALAAAILATTFAAQAGWVSGYYRSSGTFVAPYYRADYGSLVGSSRYSGASHNYVYRNPYAAYPSVHVNGYTRTDGTRVLPYHRTPPNNTLTDNLNYRGYGTIRVPRNYISAHK
jgi:hypothetical protein